MLLPSVHVYHAQHCFQKTLISVCGMRYLTFISAILAQVSVRTQGNLTIVVSLWSPRFISNIDVSVNIPGDDYQTDTHSPGLIGSLRHGHLVKKEKRSDKRILWVLWCEHSRKGFINCVFHSLGQEEIPAFFLPSVCYI